MPDFSLMAVLEILAVALGVSYVLLAIRRHVSCWVASFAASGLFVAVFLDAGLVFQPGLHVFYMAVAGYGFFKWRSGARHPARLGYWGWRNNLIAAASLAAVSIPLTAAVRPYSDSSLPFIDVATTLGALLATFLQARKYMENWIWWIVLDSLYVALYVERGLYFTAALSVLYLSLCWPGYRSWRKAHAADLARTSQSGE